MTEAERDVKKPAPARSRALTDFLVAFLAIFAGLTLPSPGLGPLYARVHVALGNLLLAGVSLPPGATLEFRASTDAGKYWEAVLHLVRSSSRGDVNVEVDLRTLAFLPTVTFIALVVATPGRARERLKRGAAGLLMLELVLIGLNAAPLASFMSLTGPGHLFALGRVTRLGLELVYRAFVVPPGMTYAIPLLLWLGLFARPRLTGPQSEAQGPLLVGQGLEKKA